VVLEIKTNTWQVYQRLDASLAELLWVTNTRALENKWRTQCSARNNNLFASFDDPRGRLARGEMLGRDNLDTDSAISFEDNLVQVISTYNRFMTLETYLLDLVASQQV
jgi:hypothetical protein